MLHAIGEFRERSIKHEECRSVIVFGRLREWPNKSVKPFACGSLGRSALRACSGMPSASFPEQPLHAERRLPGR